MREDLDKQLCEKYPKIFEQRNWSMSTTAMCWGFPGDGWYNIIDQLCANIQWRIDQNNDSNESNRKYQKMVNDARAGDFTLFNEHFNYIKHRADIIEKYRKEILEEDIPAWRTEVKEIPQVVATQVKEKYGTLRFYYDGGDEVIDGMVRMAEAMSGVTCEECGAPGKQRHGGWILTLCDTHAEEHRTRIGTITAVELNDEKST